MRRFVPVVVITICFTILGATFIRGQSLRSSAPVTNKVSDLLARDKQLSQGFAIDHPQRQVIWKQLVALDPTFRRDKALASTAHDVLAMDERELKVVVSHLLQEIQVLQTRIEDLEQPPHHRIQLLR